MVVKLTNIMIAKNIINENEIVEFEYGLEIAILKLFHTLISAIKSKSNSLSIFSDYLFYHFFQYFFS